MLTRSLAAWLLLLALSSCERLNSLGCTQRRQVRELPPAELVPSPLPSLPLQVNLPSDATVQVISGSVVMVIHPGHRTPLRIDIKRAADAGEFAGQDVKKRSLTPQLQIIYREHVEAGGSGGEDGILDGELTLGSDRYRVRCAQQSELSPSATDCLPILATLRSIAR